jgi:hypothetical protein
MALFLGVLCCSCFESSHPAGVLLRALSSGFSKKNIGFIMTVVDEEYKDDLGGSGRLRNDLHNLFLVYGALELDLELVVSSASQMKVRFEGVGRSFQFKGTMDLYLLRGKIKSGLLTDLRAVVSLLRERRMCVEENSIRCIEPLVSMEYHGNREGLMEDLKDTFLQNRHTAFMVERLDIVVEGRQTRVVQRYVLLSLMEKQKVERKGVERLTLRKEGERWRIISGKIAA